MSEEAIELIRKVVKGELPREALPKPTLLEDLGVLYPTKNSKQRRRFGVYKCGFCGNEFKAQVYHINRGDIISCGCYRASKLLKRNKTHELRYTRLYRIWIDIKNRTLNPKNKAYKDYGGRGITICDEWKNDVKSFYDWAISNGYSDELSIDRIDNDVGYSPENCRWATSTIQARNQRIPKNNKSGYRGVCYHKDNNKYIAQICVNKKNINLGYFQTADEGAIAYNNYIIENNLEGFILNEIPEEYLNKNIKEKN